MGFTAPDGEPLLGNAFQKEFAGERNARTLSFDERATRATVHRNKRPGGVPGQSWRIKGIFEAWQFMDAAVRPDSVGILVGIGKISIEIDK